MANGKKSLLDFYELPASEIMDRKLRVLPLIEQEAGIDLVLDILTESDHVWVVNFFLTFHLIVH